MSTNLICVIRANEKMKRMDGLEKNGTIGISTCIVRCEKGIYEQNLIASQNKQIIKGAN